MRKILLLACASLVLSGCATTRAVETGSKVESTVATICSSVPLAQVAYNVALRNHDSSTVNDILSVIRLSCPAVLGLIHVYQQELPPAPLPTITPERG